MPAHTADGPLRVVLALAIGLAGCAQDGTSGAASNATVADSIASSRVTAETGGEVVPDSAKPVVRWLNDANVLALANAMNAKQLSAADAELSSWHLEQVRGFAAQMAREHAALQRSIDSAAAALQLTPVSPALAPLLRVRMQRQIDSMYQHDGRAFDRAYVDQQVASHELMYLYLVRLSAVAENAGLRQMLSVIADSARSHLSRATALRATFARADSAAADSAARRAARRAARQGRGEDR